MSDLHDAWEELQAATPHGWYVGRPGQRCGGQWAMYAFDTTENAATFLYPIDDGNGLTHTVNA